ncbi:MAG: serine/threonine-protein phosphatase [Burkholderiales bacterium]|nr:serine/threonine-protein phosphatase [Burkholderiales bacterium]
MKFSIFQESRRGGRKYNQDRMGYVFSRDAMLMIVADGMGGHMHGEVAAQITVEYFGQKFQREAKPKIGDPVAFLTDSINGAHAAILQYTEDHGLLETPRTTVVAALVQSGGAIWAHAGDSRVYHIRAGQIVAQTRDHSRVQQLVLQGVVREEAVAAHPDRNKIYNCLGAHVAPQIDVSPRVALQQGDTLLLCSDGVWGPLPSRLIATAFMNEPVARAVPALMNQAERRAGADSDNLSVVAMTWDEIDAAGPNSVSTLTLPPDGYASKIDAFDQGAGHEYLSDAEIEKAIAEIRNAISKANKVVIK